jgi:hypothetical protein
VSDPLGADVAETLLVQVVPVGTPVRVAVVRSYASHESEFWDELNDNWSAYGATELVVEYSTLNKSSITHSDLEQTGADVILVEWATDLSTDEVNSITAYASHGRGIMISGSTLRICNPGTFESVLGFETGVTGHVCWSLSTVDSIDITDPAHRLWEHLPDYTTTCYSYCSGSDWDGDGLYSQPSDWEVMVASQRTSIVGYVWNKYGQWDQLGAGPISAFDGICYRAVFASHCPAARGPAGPPPGTTDDRQFHYNALVWCSRAVD